MPKERTHSFNVILGTRTFETLTRLAKELECSRAHLIRDMIRWRATMTYEHAPVCADGGRCVSPHLHPCRQNRNEAPDA